MRKPIAVTLLILLSALVTIGIPLGVIAWFNSGLAFISPVFTVPAAIVLQTAAFALLRRLYKAKYGLSSPKFVVCSVLPPMVITIIGMTALKCMVAAGVFGEPNPRFYPDSRAHAEMLCAWAVLAYAVCFTVTLSLVLAAVSAVEKRRNCPKKSALMLLAVIGNPVTFVLAVAALLLMRLLADVPILGGLAVVVLHIIASIMLFRRFRRKFGVSSGEYVGHGALPTFVISVVGGMLGLLFTVIGGGDMGYAFMAAAVFTGGYSLVYLIGISAVTSFYDPL